MNNRFSEKGQKVLMVCVKLAEEFGHTYIGTEHLLWALADVFGSSSAALLNKKGVFSSDIKKMISEEMRSVLLKAVIRFTISSVVISTLFGMLLG